MAQPIKTTASRIAAIGLMSPTLKTQHSKADSRPWYPVRTRNGAVAPHLIIGDTCIELHPRRDRHARCCTVRIRAAEHHVSCRVLQINNSGWRRGAAQEANRKYHCSNRSHEDHPENCRDTISYYAGAVFAFRYREVNETA